ncbi:hypothetical protein [Methanobacterium petrolearium]|uniref:hypothetical protein n=1 Tax=Methanobacterium petrolearium TaxID=710190 RepID=UPI001AE46255|nr:hypothetical protein [Methanobacterium petrolearium]MBP1946331.1 DNA-dependent RNA polymerase auxiliary subunit epsilon [Methanobacterium petrolearium]BDZ71434.1 hypothetical protein GCM10025861_19510 [Methanobacterium petrolearium]
MKFNYTNTISICKILNHYFPLELIINKLTEITGDDDLNDFPEIQESITFHSSLTSDAISELSEYLNRNDVIFISFVEKFVSEKYLKKNLEFYQLEFIEKLNDVLKIFELRVKHFKIQKKVYSFSKESLDDNLFFVDMNTPFPVIDYYKESLICLNNKTFRASILFSVFALEAGLKCTYKNLENCNPGKISLHALIDWATKKGVLENTDDEYDELMELKEYRNKLVHCNPTEHNDITSKIAERRAFTDLNLINQSLNSIFY